MRIGSLIVFDVMHWGKYDGISDNDACLILGESLVRDVLNMPMPTYKILLPIGIVVEWEKRWVDQLWLELA